MICTIDQAIADRALLGAALGDLKSWRAWRTILKAAFGQKLSDEELVLFKELAGGREPPSERVSELWVIAGRRSGKSRMAAAISSYLAAFAENAQSLAIGETGHVITLAPSKDQARLVRDYAAGHFSASEILKQEVVSETASELWLKGNICLGVHSNSFRTVRGRTLLAAVLEEIAFFRDEASANPDVETYRAILPALATSGGMLIGISSPYRKVGLLYEKFRDHFGANGDVLVISAATEALNPLIDRRVIARAMESDPAAALSEWHGQFRNDIASFLDDDAIDLAIDRGRPIELPPRPQLLRYFAFTDASAGRHDAFTLAIGHRDGERVVIDVVRGTKAPFDPAIVARQFAQLAKSYGCREICGDAYAGNWVAGAFRDAGIAYRTSDLVRSALYLEMLPMFARGTLSIPDHPQLIRELRLLERRTSRSGKDTIDHGTNGSDDFANSLAGCAYQCSRPQRRSQVVQVGHARFSKGDNPRRKATHHKLGA